MSGSSLPKDLAEMLDEIDHGGLVSKPSVTDQKGRSSVVLTGRKSLKVTSKQSPSEPIALDKTAPVHSLKSVNLGEFLARSGMQSNISQATLSGVIHGTESKQVRIDVTLSFLDDVIDTRTKVEAASESGRRSSSPCEMQERVSPTPRPKLRKAMAHKKTNKDGESITTQSEISDTSRMESVTSRTEKTKKRKGKRDGSKKKTDHIDNLDHVHKADKTKAISSKRPPHFDHEDLLDDGQMPRKRSIVDSMSGLVHGLKKALSGRKGLAGKDDELVDKFSREAPGTDVTKTSGDLVKGQQPHYNQATDKQAQGKVSKTRLNKDALSKTSVLHQNTGLAEDKRGHGEAKDKIDNRLVSNGKTGDRSPEKEKKICSQKQAADSGSESKPATVGGHVPVNLKEANRGQIQDKPARHGEAKQKGENRVASEGKEGIDTLAQEMKSRTQTGFGADDKGKTVTSQPGSQPLSRAQIIEKNERFQKPLDSDSIKTGNMCTDVVCAGGAQHNIPESDRRLTLVFKEVDDHIDNRHQKSREQQLHEIQMCHEKQTPTFERSPKEDAELSLHKGVVQQPVRHFTNAVTTGTTKDASRRLQNEGFVNLHTQKDEKDTSKEQSGQLSPKDGLKESQTDEKDKSKPKVQPGDSLSGPLRQVVSDEINKAAANLPVSKKSCVLEAGRTIAYANEIAQNSQKSIMGKMSKEDAGATKLKPVSSKTEEVSTTIRLAGTPDGSANNQNGSKEQKKLDERAIKVNEACEHPGVKSNGIFEEKGNDQTNFPPTGEKQSVSGTSEDIIVKSFIGKQMPPIPSTENGAITGKDQIWPAEEKEDIPGFPKILFGKIRAKLSSEESRGPGTDERGGEHFLAASAVAADASGTENVGSLEDRMLSAHKEDGVLTSPTTPGNLATDLSNANEDIKIMAPTEAAKLDRNTIRNGNAKDAHGDEKSGKTGHVTGEHDASFSKKHDPGDNSGSVARAADHAVSVPKELEEHLQSTLNDNRGSEHGKNGSDDKDASRPALSSTQGEETRATELSKKVDIAKKQIDQTKILQNSVEHDSKITALKSVTEPGDKDMHAILKPKESEQPANAGQINENDVVVDQLDGREVTKKTFNAADGKRNTEERATIHGHLNEAQDTLATEQLHVEEVDETIRTSEGTACKNIRKTDVTTAHIQKEHLDKGLVKPQVAKESVKTDIANDAKAQIETGEQPKLKAQEKSHSVATDHAKIKTLTAGAGKLTDDTVNSLIKGEMSSLMDELPMSDEQKMAGLLNHSTVSHEQKGLGAIPVHGKSIEDTTSKDVKKEPSGVLSDFLRRESDRVQGKQPQKSVKEKNTCQTDIETPCNVVSEDVAEMNAAKLTGEPPRRQSKGKEHQMKKTDSGMIQRTMSGIAMGLKSFFKTDDKLTNGDKGGGANEESKCDIEASGGTVTPAWTGIETDLAGAIAGTRGSIPKREAFDATENIMKLAKENKDKNVVESPTDTAQKERDHNSNVSEIKAHVYGKDDGSKPSQKSNVHTNENKRSIEPADVTIPKENKIVNPSSEVSPEAETPIKPPDANKELTHVKHGESKLSEHSDVDRKEKKWPTEPTDFTLPKESKIVTSSTEKSQGIKEPLESPDVNNELKRVEGDESKLLKQEDARKKEYHGSMEPNDATSPKENKAVTHSTEVSWETKEPLKSPDVNKELKRVEGDESKLLKHGDAHKKEDHGSMEPNDATSPRENKAVTPSTEVSRETKEPLKSPDVNKELKRVEGDESKLLKHGDAYKKEDHGPMEPNDATSPKENKAVTPSTEVSRETKEPLKSPDVNKELKRVEGDESKLLKHGDAHKEDHGSMEPNDATTPKENKAVSPSTEVSRVTKDDEAKPLLRYGVQINQNKAAEPGDVKILKDKQTAKQSIKVRPETTESVKPSNNEPSICAQDHTKPPLLDSTRQTKAHKDFVGTFDLTQQKKKGTEKTSTEMLQQTKEQLKSRLVFSEKVGTNLPPADGVGQKCEVSSIQIGKKDKGNVSPSIPKQNVKIPPGQRVTTPQKRPIKAGETTTAKTIQKLIGDSSKKAPSPVGGVAHTDVAKLAAARRGERSPIDMNRDMIIGSPVVMTADKKGIAICQKGQHPLPQKMQVAVEGLKRNPNGVSKTSPLKPIAEKGKQLAAKLKINLLGGTRPQTSSENTSVASLPQRGLSPASTPASNRLLPPGTRPPLGSSSQDSKPPLIKVPPIPRVADKKKSSLMQAFLSEVTSGGKPGTRTELTRRKKCLIAFYIMCLLLLIAIVFILLAVTGVFKKSQHKGVIPRIVVDDFGNLNDGSKVLRYTLRNSNAVRAQVITFGAAVTALYLPDTKGVFEDVLLGFSSSQGYRNKNRVTNPYMGATIGRTCGSTRLGQVTIINPSGGSNKTYKIDSNDGDNSKNGGSSGFDQKNWKSIVVGNSVVMSLRSEHKDMGYPGKLNVNATFELTDENELAITYTATTTTATPVNLCTNLLFNLGGVNMTRKITDSHVFHVNAVVKVERGSMHLTTGKLVKIAKSFFEPRLLDQGAEVESFGVDEVYSILGSPGMKRASSAWDKSSGRFLEVFTDQPGLGFNAGQNLNTIGKYSQSYKKYSGFYMRPQGYPDGYSYYPLFPDGVLRPHSTYQHRSVYKFSLK